MEIKLARIKKGLTQKQLCEIVRTSPKKLGLIEKGFDGKCSLDLARRLAKALDTTVQELFFNEEEN